MSLTIAKIPLIISVWAADERIVFARLQQVVFLDLLNLCLAENKANAIKLLPGENVPFVRVLK